MPARSMMSTATITVSVRCALATVGFRKSGTPLLTASTPVIAVHPLAKAFTMSQTERFSVGIGAGGGATTGTGCPPCVAVWKSPIATVTPSAAMNA